MMARQFNFFACQEDRGFVCDTLFSMLSDMYVIQERGLDQVMAPFQITTEEDLLERVGPDMIYLFHGKDMGRLVFQPLEGGLKRVDQHLSPVIEYSPSHITEAGPLQVGRIMCACQNEQDLLRLFGRIVRALKKQGQKFPEDGRFWIYPCAGRDAELLQFWGMAKPIPNPLHGR